MKDVAVPSRTAWGLPARKFRIQSQRAVLSPTAVWREEEVVKVVVLVFLKHVETYRLEWWEIEDVCEEIRQLICTHHESLAWNAGALCGLILLKRICTHEPFPSPQPGSCSQGMLL